MGRLVAKNVTESTEEMYLRLIGRKRKNLDPLVGKWLRPTPPTNIARIAVLEDISETMEKLPKVRSIEVQGNRKVASKNSFSEPQLFPTDSMHHQNVVKWPPHNMR